MGGYYGLYSGLIKSLLIIFTAWQLRLQTNKKVLVPFQRTQHSYFRETRKGHVELLQRLHFAPLIPFSQDYNGPKLGKLLPGYLQVSRGL